MLPLVRTATVSEVLGRIDEQAAQAPGGAIATDGDGTLWSGDIGEDLFAALLESKRLLASAHAPLAREASAAGMEATGTAVELAHRIHASYLAGTFPEERVCEIMTWAFAGWTEDDAFAFAGEVVAAVGLARRLHGEALRVVEHATARGLDVYVVSASPRAVVLQAARLLGIDPSRVVAASPRVSAGIIASDVERPIPYGEGKVTHLRAALGPRPLYAAMGDNAFDVALLNASSTPIAIRPKPRLVARAAEVPGLVVLEQIAAPLET
jgi:phosphatidylglycerophosphatase C